MTQQHQRITLDLVLLRYQTGEMSAYQALWHFFNIRLAPGWEQTFNFSEVRRLIGIPHTTFWRAMRRLRQQGDIVSSKLCVGCKVHLPYKNSGAGSCFEDLDDPQSESEPTSAPEGATESEPASCRERAPRSGSLRDRGVGFGRSQRRSSSSKPKKKDVRDAYASFLETLPVEQRLDFEAFCKRQMQDSTFKINLPESWLKAHHLDYWAEFERQYVKSQSTAAAVDIPQKLKDAIAAGKARLERHFSGGEFRTGVLSLDGKGWFNSIADWLASC